MSATGREWSSLPSLTSKQIARFWSRWNKNGPIPPHRPELGPCWMWTRRRDKDGYGKFQWGPKGAQVHVRAHRLSLFLTIGPYDGLALHCCDNSSCGNPEHLHPGTQAENRAECGTRGRNATGERNARYRHPEIYAKFRGGGHPRALLTDEQAAEIRRRYVPRKTVSELCKEFGVSRSVIYMIGSGKSYR